LVETRDEICRRSSLIDVAGPELAGSLTDLGLIDEYRLYLARLYLAAASRTSPVPGRPSGLSPPIPSPVRGCSLGGNSTPGSRLHPSLAGASRRGDCDWPKPGYNRSRSAVTESQVRHQTGKKPRCTGSSIGSVSVCSRTRESSAPYRRSLTTAASRLTLPSIRGPSRGADHSISPE
jgi:hypothetical protein